MYVHFGSGVDDGFIVEIGLVRSMVHMKTLVALYVLCYDLDF